MAEIARKLSTQQRYKPIAKSGINAKSAGYIPTLGTNGVGFTIQGLGSNAKYAFIVSMTFAEWNVLKRDLDNMSRSYDEHTQRHKEVDAKVKDKGRSRRVASPKAKGVRGRSG